MNFNHDILIKRIEIRFQGGFSCSMCKIEKLNNSNESTLIKEIFPEDNNSNQVFLIFKLFQTNKKIFDFIIYLFVSNITSCFV